jgi:hypothetical protein
MVKDANNVRPIRFASIWIVPVVPAFRLPLSLEFPAVLVIPESRAQIYKRLRSPEIDSARLGIDSWVI